MIIKMKRNMILITILFLILVPACASTDLPPAATPTNQVASPASLQIEPTPGPAALDPAPLITATAVAQPSPTTVPAPIDTLYQMDISLDYASRYVAVEQTIAYANKTGVALHDIVLKVEPVNYLNVFNLQSLYWQDGSPVTASTWDGAVLTVPFPEPLLPDENRIIKISYQLTLPRMMEDANLRPPIFGYTDRQINLVDWYPFVPPHTETGWMVHPRGHYGEHLTYDIADYEINLRLLNAPADLVVAASSAAETDGDWLSYRLPSARNFVFSFSAGYEVLHANAGDVALYSYAFPLFHNANAAVLQTMVNAMLLYQELFGAYPHATLSAVQADFLDGMEYDGLFYLSRGFYNTYTGTPSEYLIAIAAHETAHQWWYALVGNNQAAEPWLDEALCTYMEHIYYERYAPQALDWWWRYRVNFFEPRGLIDVSIYDKHGEFQSYRDYRDAVYLNGAVFLHELRAAIGDEVFFAFLKDYAQRHAGGIATRQSFFAVLAEHTDVDLTSLIGKYFR
jgi:hypothetical protein